MTYCSVSECSSPKRSKGLCQQHYDNLRRRGDVNIFPKSKRGVYTECSVDGCNEKHKGKGYCAHHLYSLKTYGDVHTASTLEKRHYSENCSVTECSAGSHKAGMCSHHYYSFNKYGDPLAASYALSYDGSRCSVDYCTNPAKSRGYCGAHYQSYIRNGNPILADINIRPTSGIPGKDFCTTCEKLLDTGSDFYVRIRDGVERRDSSCKKCILLQANEYRKNREPAHVKRKRTITSKLRKAESLYGKIGRELKETIISGDALCEVCMSSSNLHIDHDHDTNKVRGVLCHNCNTALGLLLEDVEIMESLKRYILKHQDEK